MDAPENQLLAPPRPRNPPHRIVIAGGGLGGLQCARALQRAGFENICILESNSDCGSGSSYQGLNSQVPWSDVQLPEYPLAMSGVTPSGKFPTAEEMQHYARAYAQEFRLLRYIKFNCKLMQLQQSARSQWQVMYTNTAEKRNFKIMASFVVICTGLHTTPHVPSYQGNQDFNGKQLHSRELTNHRQARGKTVVIVGNGRAPSDIAARVMVAQAARRVIVLNKQLHWPLPERLGCLSMRRLLFSRAGSALVPHPYYTATRLQRAKAAAAHPFKRLVWWGVLQSLKNKTRNAPGTSEAVDADSEHLEADLQWGGHLSMDHWHSIMNSGKLEMVEGRIKLLDNTGIVLDSGIHIPCDLIVYCTGFSSSYKFLDARVTAQLQIGEDGLYLYRQMVHPDVKNLAFIGTAVTSNNYVLTTALQSEWLARALRHKVVLPSENEMHTDLLAQRAWRRTRLPPSANRGGLMMPYTQDYHDQLMQDMGLRTRRKGLNIFGECFAPYSAADYGSLLDPRLKHCDFRWASDITKDLPREVVQEWHDYDGTAAGADYEPGSVGVTGRSSINLGHSAASNAASFVAVEDEDAPEGWDGAGPSQDRPAAVESGVDQPIREEEGSMQKLAALHSLHNKRLPQVELEDVQLQTGVSSTNAVTIASAVMAAGSLGSAQPCSFSDPSAPLRLPCSAPTVSGSHAGASSVDDATHSKRSSAASAKVHGHRVSPTASPAAVRRDRTLQDGRGRPLLASDYAAAAASAPCCDAGTLADARGSSGTHSVTNQLYNSELVPAYVPASRRVSATSYLTEEINSEVFNAFANEEFEEVVGQAQGAAGGAGSLAMVPIANSSPKAAAGAVAGGAGVHPRSPVQGGAHSNRSRPNRHSLQSRMRRRSVGVLSLTSPPPGDSSRAAASGSANKPLARSSAPIDYSRAYGSPPMSPVAPPSPARAVASLTGGLVLAHSRLSHATSVSSAQYTSTEGLPSASQSRVGIVSSVDPARAGAHTAPQSASIPSHGLQQNGLVSPVLPLSLEQGTVHTQLQVNGIASIGDVSRGRSQSLKPRITPADVLNGNKQLHPSPNFGVSSSSVAISSVDTPRHSTAYMHMEQLPEVEEASLVEDNSRAPTTAADVLRAKLLADSGGDPTRMLRVCSDSRVAATLVDELVGVRPAHAGSADHGGPLVGAPVRQAFGKAAVDAGGNLTFRRASHVVTSVPNSETFQSQQFGEGAVSTSFTTKTRAGRASADYDPAIFINTSFTAATNNSVEMAAPSVPRAPSAARTSVNSVGAGGAVVGNPSVRHMGRPSNIMSSHVLEMLASPPPAISAQRARRMSAIHNSATNPVAQPPSNLSNTTMLMETGGAGGGPLLTTMPHSPDPNTNSSMGELGSSGTVGVPGANTGASPKRSYGAAGALGGLGSLGSQEAVGRGGTPRAASNAQYAAERTAAGAAEQVFQGILTMGVDILAQTHQANQQQRVGFMSRRRASKANAQVDGGLSKLRAITSFTQTNDPSSMSFTTMRKTASVTGAEVTGQRPLITPGGFYRVDETRASVGGRSSSQTKGSGSGRGMMMRLFSSFRK